MSATRLNAKPRVRASFSCVLNLELALSLGLKSGQELWPFSPALLHRRSSVLARYNYKITHLG